MLSEEHELFVGTKNGDVVASAGITATDDSLLISDVVNQHDQDCAGFAKQLLNFGHKIKVLAIKSMVGEVKEPLIKR